MASNPQIQRCLTVVEETAPDAVRELAETYPDDRSLVLDMDDVSSVDESIATDVLRNPETMEERFVEAVQAHARNADDISPALAEVHVRFENLPDDSTYTVGEQRAEDTYRLISLEGQVTKRTEVNPKLDIAVFECVRCGSERRIEQEYGNIDDPDYCEMCTEQAGQFVRGSWVLNRERSEWVDHQLVRLQQPPEDAIDGATANIDIHLLDDLCGDLEGGTRATLTGMFVPVPNKGRTVHKKTIYGNSYSKNDELIDDLDLSEYTEEIERLQNKPDVYSRLVGSVASDHQGNWHAKEAITLQLFGGWSRDSEDGAHHRGDSHILLIGDPGVGKTVLLRGAAEIAPRTAMSDGTGSSSAGLTAALTKDDFGDEQWSIEAGTIVRANKGLAVVDELDKGDTSDLDSLHTALESQEVLVSKGGRHAHLPAKTALLGAGNPTGGHFDPTKHFAEQIELQSPLLSRFDLIFVMREHVQETKVRTLADHIVEERDRAGRNDLGLPVPDAALRDDKIEKDVLTAYIAHARQSCFPVMTEDVKAELKDFYADLKLTLPNRYTDGEGPPLPVTARKLDAAMRLAEASARTRFSDEVEMVDVDRATRLVTRSLADIGIEPGEDSAIGRAPEDVEAADIGLGGGA